MINGYQIIDFKKAIQVEEDDTFYYEIPVKITNKPLYIVNLKDPITGVLYDYAIPCYPNRDNHWSIALFDGNTVYKMGEMYVNELNGKTYIEFNEDM